MSQKTPLPSGEGLGAQARAVVRFGGFRWATARLVAIIVSCVAPGAVAKPADLPGTPRWAAVAGAPNSGCMHIYWSIHSKPTYALQAVSEDAQVVWLIAADERGLHAMTCRMPGDVSEVMEMALLRVDLGQIKRDLAQSTVDLFPAGEQKHDAKSGLRSRYLAEILRLSADLDRPLGSLVTYMKAHEPQFLDGKIHVNMPAMD